MTMMICPDANEECRKKIKCYHSTPHKKASNCIQDNGHCRRLAKVRNCVEVIGDGR